MPTPTGVSARDVGTIGVVPSISGGARPLTMDDLEWVLDACGRRRAQLAAFAPRLWRSAPDARAQHRAYLGRQIEDPAVVALRTDHGFVLAAPHGQLMDVDDMALDDETLWPVDGVLLLRFVLKRGDLRLVCPVPERTRTQTAIGLGMSLTESWWHRDLDPGVSAGVAGNSDVMVNGASGRLVTAPPVYAPGGPVLVICTLDTEASLSPIEDVAASEGAVVSVVPRSPRQPTDALVRAGYLRTTDFFSWHG